MELQRCSFDFSQKEDDILEIKSKNFIAILLFTFTRWV
jgi:hypothetical protein